MFDSDDFIFAGLICLGLCGLTFCIGGVSATEQMKKEAIKNNCAEYVVDRKTGNVKFEWKNNEQ
jgi:hypothetical protein